MKRKRLMTGLIAVAVVISSALSAQAGFSPTNIPNCRMWLDASAITGKVNGDRVIRWEDSSTNNVDMGTLKSRYGNSDDRSPIYQTSALAGRPVLQFSQDGTVNDLMSSGSVWASGANNLELAQPATLITVYAPRSAVADSTIWAFEGSQVQYHNNRIGSQAIPYPVWIASVTEILNTYNIDTLTFQGTDVISQYYRNGTLFKSGAVGTTASGQNGTLGNNLVLGAKAGTASSKPVDYAEVIAVNRAVDSNELNALNFYLEMKYDLATAAGGVMLTTTAPGSTVFNGGTLAARGDVIDLVNTNRGSVAIAAAAVSEAPTLTIGLDLEDTAGPLDTTAAYSFLTNLSDNATFYSVTQKAGDVEFLITFSNNVSAVHYFEWDFTPLSPTIQLEGVSAYVPPLAGTLITIR